MLIFTLLQEQPLIALLWIVSIIYAITVHEFSHALAAMLQGDYTAKYEGRLTLNPLVHLDPLGTIALLFIGFGWGKPVMFNPFNLRNSKFGPAIVGLAGPLANFISIIIFSGALWLIVQSIGIDLNNLAINFFLILVQINLILLLFNLIPIPPLDGSKLLFALLPERYHQVIYFLERYGTILLLILLIGFGNVLSIFWDSVYSMIIQFIIY